MFIKNDAITKEILTNIIVGSINGLIKLKKENYNLALDVIKFEETVINPTIIIKRKDNSIIPANINLNSEKIIIVDEEYVENNDRFFNYLLNKELVQKILQEYSVIYFTTEGNKNIVKVAVNNYAKINITNDVNQLIKNINSLEFREIATLKTSPLSEAISKKLNKIVEIFNNSPILIGGFILLGVILTPVSKFIENIFNKISENKQEAYIEFENQKLNEIYTKIFNYLLNIINKVYGKFKIIVNFAKKLFNLTLNSLKQGINKNLLNESIQDLKKFILQNKDIFMNTVKKISENITNKINEKSIKNSFTTIITSITNLNIMNKTTSQNNIDNKVEINAEAEFLFKNILKVNYQKLYQEVLSIFNKNKINDLESFSIVLDNEINILIRANSIDDAKMEIAKSFQQTFKYLFYGSLGKYYLGSSEIIERINNLKQNKNVFNEIYKINQMHLKNVLNDLNIFENNIKTYLGSIYIAANTMLESIKSRYIFIKLLPKMQVNLRYVANFYFKKIKDIKDLSKKTEIESHIINSMKFYETALIISSYYVLKSYNIGQIFLKNFIQKLPEKLNQVFTEEEQNAIILEFKKLLKNFDNELQELEIVYKHLISDELSAFRKSSNNKNKNNNITYNSYNLSIDFS